MRCEGQGSCLYYPYFENDEEHRNIHNVFGFKNISMFNATLHEQMTNATINYHINNSSFLCLSFFFSCPTLREKNVFFWKDYFELYSLLLIYLFFIDYHINNLSFLCLDLVFFTFIILLFFLCNSEKKMFFIVISIFFWNYMV